MGMAKKMLLAPALALPPGDLPDGDTLFARASVPCPTRLLPDAAERHYHRVSRARSDSGFQAPDEAPTE